MMETIFALILVFVGAIFIFRLRLFFLRKNLKLIIFAFKKDKNAKKGGITPFKAFAASLGGSVGTGNIAGVAGAIIIGGPGTVIWIFISSIFSTIIKYIEIFLSIRMRTAKGENFGSITYIARAFPKSGKFLSLIYAILTALTAFGIGNAVQANTISDSVISMFSSAFIMTDKAIIVIKVLTGAIFAFMLFISLKGGENRIFSLLSIIVPIMSVLYVCAGLIVIFSNLDALLPTLKFIITDAFSTAKPAAAGVLSFAFIKKASLGLTRGIFSNEAGLGSSAIAHANSTASDPVKEGALGILEVFIDTVVICGITAFTILVSGVAIPYADAGASTSVIAANAFASVFGIIPSNIFLTVSIIFFAFSSMLSWAYYGFLGIKYAFGRKFIKYYRLAFCAVAMLGATVEATFVWEASNFLNLLMTVPNCLALFALFNIVKRDTDFFFSLEKKRGRTYNSKREKLLYRKQY
ncbi:MAG: amino acid carrier protein [Clostridia bacterium]